MGTETRHMPEADAPGSERSALMSSVAALIADMDGRAPDAESGLAELLTSAIDHVPGAQFAGITVAQRQKEIVTAAATHHYPVLLDRIQQQHRDGPCVSAAWDHHTVLINDLESDERWPRYQRDAVAQTPIRSILSFELFASNDVMGALNFHADRPHAFNQDSIDIGMIYATHTALAWRMLRRDEQFRSALASRDIIGQAKGMIMERFAIDAVQAFELIKRLSQSSNTKIIDVAARLVQPENRNRDR